MLLGAILSIRPASAQDSVHVTLQKAIEIALSENPTVKIADRTIEAKRYYKSEQIAALFPSLTGTASYQRTVKKQTMVMSMGGQATEIEVGSHLDTIEYDYPTFHLSMDCYLCSVISGKLELLEHENAAWLSKETLRSVNWLPADISILDKVEKLIH